MAGIEARFGLSWPGFGLDVDLHLPGQGITALFGPSGSGKTTLLRCIAGLTRAPHGRLVVDGTVWQDTSRWLPTHKRPIGYVFQEASLLPHLTVLGNLRYGLRRVAGVQHQALDQAIALLGIAHLLARKPDKLSGGERQRVAMARALALQPRLLLLDEPLAALDYAKRQEILPWLERLRDELRVPMLYVTHAADEVARLAEQVVVLDAGRVKATGTVNDVLSAVASPIVLGEDVGALVQARIVARDAAWHLLCAEFDQGRLWLADHGAHPGQAVRLRVLARDVSIHLLEPQHTSIQNHVPAVVETIANGQHPSEALVHLRCGQVLLLARVTQRAVHALQLQPGLRVWAQIKTVAVIG